MKTIKKTLLGLVIACLGLQNTAFSQNNLSQYGSLSRQLIVQENIARHQMEIDAARIRSRRRAWEVDRPRTQITVYRQNDSLRVNNYNIARPYSSYRRSRIVAW